MRRNMFNSYQMGARNRLRDTDYGYGSSRLSIVPSAALDETGMTVVGVIGGIVVGAGLMHLAHRRGWLGMGSSPARVPATTPATSNPGGRLYYHNY